MSEDSIASFYDFLLCPVIKPVRKKILEIVGKRAYGSMLDVCCGTGNQLKYLKRHGFRGTGIDISDKMLGVAARGKHFADCLKQDAGSLEFENDSFDMAMTTFALHDKTTETARTMLREMTRVVKPGGHVILVDFNVDPSVPVLARKICTFIESLAGGEHYANYRHYCATGGLDVLATDPNLREIERHDIDLRAVTVRVLEKTADG